MLRSLPRRPLASLLVLVAALVLHGFAAWLLIQRAPVVPRDGSPVAVRISLRWLPPLREASRDSTPASAWHEAERASPPRRRPTAASTPSRPAATPPTEPSQPAAGVPARAATLPDATTSSPAAPQDARTNGLPPPSILDSPGTRRAIRDAALAPSLSALDGTTDEPGQTAKLGAAIASGARGDCSKGEFAGGGMGLLSLPFWAIAQLREKCSH